MPCTHKIVPRLLPVFSGFIILVLAVFVSSNVNAVPIAVRFSEGVTHGFLLVRSLEGKIIGQGEVTQVARDNGLVESRLVFTFNDGSLHDEQIAFSQKGVLTLLTYHLIQRGPSFPEQVEVFFDRGKEEYQVHRQSKADDTEVVHTGKLTLPDDVYNGMVITSLLNLPKGSSGKVKIFTFTPEPELINLELLPMGEHPIRIGGLSRKALKYEFKPDIGIIREWLGGFTGRLPEQFHYHCWVLADEIPSFVHYEGPLQLMGPIIRVELAGPDLFITPDN